MAAGDQFDALERGIEQAILTVTQIGITAGDFQAEQPNRFKSADVRLFEFFEEESLNWWNWHGNLSSSSPSSHRQTLINQMRDVDGLRSKFCQR